MNFSVTRRLLAVAAFAMCIAPANLSAQELTGTLAKISESGEIVIGHRESSVPFSYLDDNHNPIGYSTPHPFAGGQIFYVLQMPRTYGLRVGYEF